MLNFCNCYFKNNYCPVKCKRLMTLLDHLKKKFCLCTLDVLSQVFFFLFNSLDDIMIRCISFEMYSQKFLTEQSFHKFTVWFDHVSISSQIYLFIYFTNSFEKRKLENCSFLFNNFVKFFMQKNLFINWLMNKFWM